MNSFLKFRIEFLVVLLGVFLLSCTTSSGDSEIDDDHTNPGTGTPVTDAFCATITYAKDIKPIIDSSCIQCHGNGGSSPNLTTYNNIKNSAYSIKSQVVSRNMPQGSTLTANEIKAISCWVDAGAINN